MREIKIKAGNGVQVEYGKLRILLDPYRQENADFVFISHAHIDHLSIPDEKVKVITSKETAYLARQRGFEFKNMVHRVEGFQLLDSGHILGSKSLLINDEVFYTSDFAYRERAFLRKGRVHKARILIIEATYGKRNFVFSQVAKIVDEVNRIIAQMFDKGIPVVLLGYPLGKAQVISYLFSSWEPIYLHASVKKMNEAYRDLGVKLDDYLSYSEAKEKGLLQRKPWILIAPLSSGRKGFIANLKKKYSAVTIGFSGWACDKSYKYAMALDYAFPLSDHSDFNELISIVKACEPEKVYTTHGFASDLAAYLRKLGYDAEPLLGLQTSIADYMGEE
jgi:putative mRNA 3-end processing factor